MITSSTCAGSILALFIASFKTAPANLYTGISRRDPPNLPIGVRTPLTITTFFNFNLLCLNGFAEKDNDIYLTRVRKVTSKAAVFQKFLSENHIEVKLYTDYTGYDVHLFSLWAKGSFHKTLSIIEAFSVISLKVQEDKGSIRIVFLSKDLGY